MPTISSMSNDVPIKQDNSQGVTAKADAESADKNKALDTSSDNRNRVELSSRAQKIQKLNEEFFPAGPQSVKITPAFIERLSEYGFLSKDEASKLSSTATTSGDSSTSALGELTDFIDRFSDEMKAADPDNSLISTLQKAKSIIDNFDGSKPSSMANDIKTVTAELIQYSNSTEAQALSSDDKESLDQLELALKVADKLNPENLSSKKINGYLAVLNRFS